MFTPLHDGCLDRDPLPDPADELSEYRAELDRLHDPVADQDQDADDTGFEIDDTDDSPPWDD